MAGTRLQKPSPVPSQQRSPPNTLRKKPPPVSMHSYPAMPKQRPPPPVSFDNTRSAPAVPTTTRRRHGSLSAVAKTAQQPQYQYQYYAPYQATPLPDPRSTDGRRGWPLDVVDDTTTKNQ
ncbi:hypothetical protein PG994_005434 [Apiospora phragmitis]|uniref:Uncharacterized protein n=1 Tax=Apiospora phragmitis TaxID=2905665 RepID=A0ABR1VC83_9PEZI